MDRSLYFRPSGLGDIVSCDYLPWNDACIPSWIDRHDSLPGGNISSRLGSIVVTGDDDRSNLRAPKYGDVELHLWNELVSILALHGAHISGRSCLDYGRRKQDEVDNLVEHFVNPSYS